MADGDTKLHFLTIKEAGQLLRRGELSPVELIRASLERIDNTDGQLHSFITLLREEALGQARTAEAEILRGDCKGPLHGIPIALKDLYDTARGTDDFGLQGGLRPGTSSGRHHYLPAEGGWEHTHG